MSSVDEFNVVAHCLPATALEELIGILDDARARHVNIDAVAIADALLRESIARLEAQLAPIPAHLREIASRSGRQFQLESTLACNYDVETWRRVRERFIDEAEAVAKLVASGLSMTAAWAQVLPPARVHVPKQEPLSAEKRGGEAPRPHPHSGEADVPAQKRSATDFERRHDGDDRPITPPQTPKLKPQPTLTPKPAFVPRVISFGTDGGGIRWLGGETPAHPGGR